VLLLWATCSTSRWHRTALRLRYPTEVEKISELRLEGREYISVHIGYVSPFAGPRTHQYLCYAPIGVLVVNRNAGVVELNWVRSGTVARCIYGVSRSQARTIVAVRELDADAVLFCCATEFRFRAFLGNVASEVRLKRLVG